MLGAAWLARAWHWFPHGGNQMSLAIAGWLWARRRRVHPGVFAISRLPPNDAKSKRVICAVGGGPGSALRGRPMALPHHAELAA